MGIRAAMWTSLNPSLTPSTIGIDQHRLLIAQVPYLKAQGLRKVRVELPTVPNCPAPDQYNMTTLSWLDEIMTDLAEAGLGVLLQTTDMPPDVVAWRTPYGVGNWDDFRRPPTGAGGAMAKKGGKAGAYLANYTFDAYVGAGGDPGDFDVQHRNEIEEGGAGFPTAFVAAIEAYNDGFFVGTIDTTAHWTEETPNGWADLVSPTHPVTGAHEYLEYSVPSFFEDLNPDIKLVIMPATTTENIQNWLASCFNPSFTWHAHPRWRHGGKLRLSMNRYQGLYSGVVGHPLEIAANYLYLYEIGFNAIKDGIEEPCRIYGTEVGFDEDWLTNGSYGRAKSFLRIGRAQRAVCAQLALRGHVAFMFALAGWDSGTNRFAGLQVDGSWRANMQQILGAGGYSSNNAPNGSAWSVASGDPKTLPSSTSSSSGTL